MNNMNLRRPNDCGCKTNYNANCNTNCSSNTNCNTNRNTNCNTNHNTNCNTNCNTNHNTNCNTNCNTNYGNNTPSCGCNPNCDAGSSIYNDPLKGMTVAIGYVPWQQWCKVYDLCKGLNQGTIFPSLDLPFYGCIPRGYFNGQGGAL